MFSDALFRRHPRRKDEAAVTAYEQAPRPAHGSVVTVAEVEAFSALTASQVDLLFERFQERRGGRPAPRRSASSPPRGAARQTFAWFGLSALATVVAYGIALGVDGLSMSSPSAGPAADPAVISAPDDAWEYGLGLGLDG
ncbi:hypothetical protein [Microbacterium azadirachtae]|uniref:hypothetical protein n=1 Tax=Microbacterium azadirachtae TaxID=582680 RepID=UPI0005EC408D|nr:hypothetical protein [Microbacterium azadirachtae]